LIVSIEGTNNFRDEYAPAFGAVISKTLSSRVAVYAQPVWVGNTNNGELLHPHFGPFLSSDDSTFMVGVVRTEAKARPTPNRAHLARGMMPPHDG